MEEKILSPLKSIRKFCLACVGNRAKEVEFCLSKNCPLYVYRFGKDVRRTKTERTPKQIEAAKQNGIRLNKAKNEKRKVLVDNYMSEILHRPQSEIDVFDEVGRSTPKPE